MLVVTLPSSSSSVGGGGDTKLAAEKRRGEGKGRERGHNGTVKPLCFLFSPFHFTSAGGLHFAAKMLRQARTPLLPTKKGPTDATFAVHSLPLIRRRLRARSQFLKKEGGREKKKLSFLSLPFFALDYFFCRCRSHFMQWECVCSASSSSFPETGRRKLVFGIFF